MQKRQKEKSCIPETTPSPAVKEWEEYLHDTKRKILVPCKKSFHVYCVLWVSHFSNVFRYLCYLHE